MSIDVEAVIREAMLNVAETYGLTGTERIFAAGLAAAVRLLREPAELPEGWFATRWEGYLATIKKDRSYRWECEGPDEKIIFGRASTLASAIAAVAAARSSGR